MKRYLLVLSFFLLFLTIGCEGLPTGELSNVTTSESTTEISTTVDLISEWTTTATPTTEDLTTATPITDGNDNNVINQVIVDNDMMTMTIIETYEDSFWGYSIKIFHENKTDSELMFVLDDVLVNGYVINTFWVNSLPAGAKAYETFHLSSSDMEDSGISSVDKIEMYMRVYDYDDWMADDLINDIFTIYPTGLSEEEIVSPERPSSETEYLLVDNQDLTFIIIETYEDSIWGYSIKVYLENKTDSELMFALDDVVVNGYVINALWVDSPPAGAKAVETFNLSSSDMEDSGITSVDKIELYMRIYDYDDWMADDLINDKFTIYPTELEEEEIVSPERPSSETEYLLVDNQYFTFIIIETYVDSIWGYSIKIYLENKTDSELMFTWDDVRVNDYMIDPYWAKSLMPNSKAITSISFYESDFEENNIEMVDKIDFILSIYDSNDWMADDLLNSPFTYRP